MRPNYHIDDPSRRVIIVGDIHGMIIPLQYVGILSKFKLLTKNAEICSAKLTTFLQEMFLLPWATSSQELLSKVH